MGILSATPFAVTGADLWGRDHRVMSWNTQS